MEQATTTDKNLTTRAGKLINLIPEDAEGVFRISKYLAASDLVPKSFGGRAENVFAAIMMGREIGVSAMQALSNIAVVNGRASVWGELATALVRDSGSCESLEYSFKGDGPTLECTAIGKRKGDAKSHSVTYTMQDAARGGDVIIAEGKLKGVEKNGKIKDTYVKRPKDMLMYKALHRLYKFLWPDALKGLSIREVADEDDMKDVTPIVEIEKPSEPPNRAAEEKPVKPEPAKAETAKPKPSQEPERKPEPAKEEPIQEDLPETPAEVLTRHLGTLVKGAKFTDDDGEHYVLVIQKAGTGEIMKFMVNDLATCKEIVGKFKGKAMEVFSTPCILEGVTGKAEKWS